jgi:gliding motility-associated-like protein
MKRFVLISLLIVLSFVTKGQGIGNGCPDVIDQQVTSFNSGTTGTDQWQSFTCGITGLLTRIDVETNSCPSYTYALSIYSGVGVGGTLLYSGVFNNPGLCNNWQPANIPVASAPAVTNGNVYTVRFQSTTGMFFVVHTGNIYSGSYYSNVYGTPASWDLNFRSYVQLTSYPSALISAPSLSICPANTLAITGNNPTFNHQWYNSAGIISGATGQNYTATAAGPIAMVVTNTTTNCFATSNTLNVLANPVSTVMASYTICNGNSLTLTSIPTGTSNWNTSATTLSISVSPNAYTQYFVQSNAPSGCITQTTTDVYVNASPTLNINPNTVTVTLGSLQTNVSDGSTITYTFADPLPANARIFAYEFDFDAVDQGWGGSGCNLNTLVSNNGAGAATLSHTLTHFNYLVPTSASSYTYAGTNNVGINFCGWGGWQAFSYNTKLIIHYDMTLLPGCAGASRTLTAAGANSYAWLPVITNGVGFTPAATTVYTVTGTMSTGCTATRILTLQVNPVPTLSLTGASTVCAGSSLTQSISGANTYSWSTGGSNTNYNFTPNPNLTYTVQGTYTLTGCSSQVVRTVSSSPIPTIGIPNYTLCAGNSLTLIPNGASTYTFSSVSAIVTPAASTNYSVTGTSTAGCVGTNTAVTAVTVYSLPIVSASSGTICTGNSFAIGVNGGVSYSITGNSFNVSPSNTTSYSITGMSSAGCTNTLPAVSTVSVYTRPSISVNSGSICQGMVLTMTPTGAFTYTFSNGSATVSPLTNATYSVTGTSTAGCVGNSTAICNVTVFATPTIAVTSGSICSGRVFTIQPSGASVYFYSSGTTTVSPLSTTVYSVTGTSSAGCNSSVTALCTVSVDTTPTITVANGTICIGQSFTLNPQGANSYSIQGGSAIVNPASSSNYQIIGLSAKSCTSLPVTASVSVNALPNVVANINPSVICFGSSVTPIASGAATYTWSGNLVNNTAASPSQSSSYTVTGIDLNGCLNTTVTSLTVRALPILTITSNNGTSCEAETVTLTALGANTYTWVSQNTGNTSVVSPTSTSVYTVIGQDLNGCKNTSTFSQSVVICVGSFTAHHSAQDVECQGKANGIINVYAGSNYSQQHIDYIWTPNTLCPNKNCDRVDSLDAGIYKVKVMLTYTLNNFFVKKDSILLGPIGIDDKNGLCNVTIYRGISANIDGSNDHLFIENIEEFPKNKVTVFNRWGIQLVDIAGYNNQDKTWPTTEQLDKLQASTYFYVIDLGDGSKPIKGWIELIKK